MSNIEVYSDKEFTLSFSKMKEMAFIHCTINEWKPSVMKRLYQVFSKFLNERSEYGVATVATLTPNPKFAELYGGKFYTTVTSPIGKKLEMYVWE